MSCLRRKIRATYLWAKSAKKAAEGYDDPDVEIELRLIEGKLLKLYSSIPENHDSDCGCGGKKK